MTIKHGRNTRMKSLAEGLTPEVRARIIAAAWCPTCDAKPGRPCRNRSTEKTSWRLHSPRIHLAIADTKFTWSDDGAPNPR